MKLLGRVLSLLLILLAIYPSLQAKSPILLVNGILGAELSVRDQRTAFFNLVPHVCSTGDRFETLWVGLRLLKCGSEELSLQYNTETRQFRDRPRITVSVPGFGSTDSVEFLGFVPYLETFVSYFVDRGYERGKSIRAAPYDWRLAADELERRGYYDRFKALVEKMYRDNGNERVTIVAHSMGGLVSHYFLTGYSGINQGWKDRYINAWVTLSGAWSGGSQAVASVISGKQFGSINVDFLGNFLTNSLASFLVPIARSFQSIPWLLPRASVFDDIVIISTPSRDYTAANYKELFNKVKYDNGYEIHRNLLTFHNNFPSPNVTTYCYYGVGVPTPKTFIYTEDLDDTIIQPAMTIHGDGDGTVNKESSVVCHGWGEMRQPLHIRQYNGVGHQAIVREVRVLNDIALIVGASPPRSIFSRA